MHQYMLKINTYYRHNNSETYLNISSKFRSRLIISHAPNVNTAAYEKKIKL